MVAAVGRRRRRRRRVQTRIHQQILENKKKRKILFVPIDETTKKASKKREESLNRVLESIQESLKNDPTRELKVFLKKIVKGSNNMMNGFSYSWRGC